MKRFFMIMITVCLAMSAFSQSAQAEQLVGGWELPESPTITEELQEIFDLATEGMLGVTYTPVALLGTQLVAGMNYRYLCEARVVYPGVSPYYVQLTVYRDLQGNAVITAIEAVESQTLNEQAAFGGEGLGSAPEQAGRCTCSCGCCRG